MVRVLAVVALFLLSGCVRAQEVETVVYTVFLPAIQHDCSWIVRDQEYRDAVAVCQARMQVLRVQESRVRMPDDCETPAPEDYCRE